MAIKFREIEVFWAVYKTQSVNEAARFLNVSQPAVSMMLKGAEQRFGVRLFNRSGGRVHPTAEARHLFAYAESLFLDLQEVERQMHQLREGRAGSVSVAATQTLAAVFVHPILPAFQSERSRVRVVLRIVPSEQTVDMVARRLVDFGIVYGPRASPDVDVEELGATQIACVFRADHPLAKKTLITPADLVGESIATYRQDTPLGREMERTLREAGLDIEISVQSTALTAAQLADRGFGVALIDPLALSGGLFQNLTVRPFEPVTLARVQIVRPKNDMPSKASQHLMLQIRSGFSRHTSLTRAPAKKPGSGRAQPHGSASATARV